MSWLHPGATAVATAPEASPAPLADVEHPAPGLKQALDRLPRPGAAVLDFGPALSANIEFFRRLQARVRVIDFESTLHEIGLWDAPKKMPLWEEGVARALKAGADEQFDLILVWDFPNYFGRERWPAVARWLVERLRPGGVVHLFVRSGREMPARPGHFRITASETVREQPRVLQRIEPPRLSHGEIERIHPGLAAVRSFLDKQGVQEFLLEHAAALNLPPRAVAQPRKPRSFYPG